MVSVTDKQLDFILNDIVAHGIITEDLQENLLDHICCIVENEMNTEDDFFKFYERILPRFFTDELREIQEETDKLLTFKEYYAMKNTLVKSGLISTALTLFGVLFKLMHWPGASVMFVLGVATFGLLFIPLLIVLKFKDEAETIDKWVLSIGLVLGMITSIGVLFKVMHWPFANILILSSLSAFILLFIPTYFITKVRRADLKFNTIVNSVLMMACGCLLFALFGMGNSQAYKKSITPTYSSLIENTEKMNGANLEISADVNDYEDFEVLHTKSRFLYDRIDDIKTNLIAESEAVSVAKAKEMEIADLKFPDDTYVVQKVFVYFEGELSLDALMLEVTGYNSIISDKYPNRDEKVLEIDTSQFKHSAISIVLSELTQIQLQIATNENVYLNQLSNND
ncbi:hypothetical protein N9F08_01195 [bacterium]|nr:hypothetical protein [bacterium]